MIMYISIGKYSKSNIDSEGVNGVKVSIKEGRDCEGVMVLKTVRECVCVRIGRKDRQRGGERRGNGGRTWDRKTGRRG